jgi:hypothetical protein
MEYPTTRGVTQYPTNTTRLEVLNRVAAELFNERKRQLDILEIGSLYGDSAKILGKYGRVDCVDLWDWDGGYAEFKKNTSHLNINAFRMPSSDLLPMLGDKIYDLIYIDGCHTYPIVIEDMNHAKRLIKPGGIICGDDLERKITSYEEYLQSKPFVDIDYVDGYHPGVSCAVYEMFKTDVMVEYGFWWTA